MRFSAIFILFLQQLLRCTIYVSTNGNKVSKMIQRWAACYAKGDAIRLNDEEILFDDAKAERKSQVFLSLSDWDFLRVKLCAVLFCMRSCSFSLRAKERERSCPIPKWQPKSRSGVFFCLGLVRGRNEKCLAQSRSISTFGHCLIKEWRGLIIGTRGKHLNTLQNWLKQLFLYLKPCWLISWLTGIGCFCRYKETEVAERSYVFFWCS